jgi:hypothetical protein
MLLKKITFLLAGLILIHISPQEIIINTGDLIAIISKVLPISQTQQKALKKLIDQSSSEGNESPSNALAWIDRHKIKSVVFLVSGVAISTATAVATLKILKLLSL